MNLRLTMEPASPQRYEHRPVLARAVVQAFHFRRPAFVIDGTLGSGGHTERTLRHYPALRVRGLEWDAEALRLARKRLEVFGDRFEGLEWSYADLPKLLSLRGIEGVDGVLLDLGLSSLQLQDTMRGFSFLRPGPLDMRMSSSLRRTAWNVVEELDRDELAHLFKTYGEEPRAQRAARALKDALARGALPNDAWQVANCIRLAVSDGGRRTDPATRCFQALRIVVNGELKNLDHFLSALNSLLR